MPSAKTYKVALFGSTGTGGSYIALELLSRGHHVIGISRSPEKLGSHPNYTPKSLDIEKASIADLVATLKDAEVVVNAYGPHSSGASAMTYQPIVEVSRKVILASCEARIQYLLAIGGSGSLWIPDSLYDTVLERTEWWLAYQRAMANSPGFLNYLEGLFPPEADAMRKYGEARRAVKQGVATEADRECITAHEYKALNDDTARPFIMACRACYMFFHGNTSFRWSFLSPPLLYRPGPRSGSYEVSFDTLPLKAGYKNDMDNVENYLEELSTGDLAVAVADEVEGQDKMWKHWSAVKTIEGVGPFSTFAKL